MVDSFPQETARSLASLTESQFEAIDFRCSTEVAHSELKDVAVINMKTGKLDCKKCMIRKGLNSSILKIGYLKKNLIIFMEDTLDNLENTQETIEQNIEHCKSNIFFKIMQNLSGDYSSQTQTEDLAKIKELKTQV